MSASLQPPRLQYLEIAPTLDYILSQTLDWLRDLSGEVAISLSDSHVWFAFAAALAFGVICGAIGTWASRRVGLLEGDAPAGEVLGVGLGAGMLIVAAFWAAVASGGRSSFTPVALVLAAAIALGKPGRQKTDDSGRVAQPTAARDLLPNAPLIRMLLAGSLSLVLLGTLYGATLAPSPRNDVQPVEFLDEAFYSVLGADLARTGTESIYSPSGFAELPGIPVQSWYHWGELWLAAGSISLFGLDPVFARHYVVLPLALLAAAALTGTLVRRLGGTSSRAAFVLGAAVCLLLAPVPLPGTFFGGWARSLLFGITMYGLAAITVLLVACAFLRIRTGSPSLGLSAFFAAAVASVLPAHIVIALLGAFGASSALALQLVLHLMRRERLPQIPAMARRTLALTGLAVAATIGWGLASGHGIGASGMSPSVSPFNESWRESLTLTVLGSGVLLAIPLAWQLTRRTMRLQASLYAGTVMLLIAGAIAWGARLGDFTMFHVFFGGIAVFATPAAAIAIWTVWAGLRRSGRLRMAAAVVTLTGVQLVLGGLAGVVRLQQFGPREYKPIPLEVIATISQLPANAKLAYACGETEELAFWNPRLGSITAHTGRPVVPMCFEAEYFGLLTGTAVSKDVRSPLFEHAPQRAIYPDSSARPSSATVAAFLLRHGVEYIYADEMHPNTLVSGAIPISTRGDVTILRIP